MGLNVLSLCDGISCGKVALERLGIIINRYYAAEINANAIAISQSNHSDVIKLGCITKVNPGKLPKIDLVLAGTPCQGFSFAGKMLNFDDPRSSLYFQFERILNDVRKNNPNVLFLLENVPMAIESQTVITNRLGVEPITINSALLSAQNRKRLYWSNIPDLKAPTDSNIYLRDILEYNIQSDHIGLRLKSNCLRVGGRNSPLNSRHCWDSPFIKVNRRLEPKKDQSKASCLTVGGNAGGNHSDMDIIIIQRPRGFNKGGELLRNKSPCLTSNSWEHNNHIKIDDLTARRFSVTECERLQTLPDGYTQNAGVSKTQQYTALGNAWTVDVICHILSYIKPTFFSDNGYNSRGAYRTHSIRRTKTEQEIISAINQFKTRWPTKKVTKAGIARLVSVRREELSRNYNHLF